MKKMKNILIALFAVALLGMFASESQAGVGGVGRAVGVAGRSRTVVRTRGVGGVGFGGAGFGRAGFIGGGFGRVGFGGVGFNRFGVGIGGFGFNRFGFGGVGFGRAGFGFGGLGYGAVIGGGGLNAVYGANLLGVGTCGVAIQPALLGVSTTTYSTGFGAAYGVPSAGLLGAGVCP